MFILCTIVTKIPVFVRRKFFIFLSLYLWTNYIYSGAKFQIFFYGFRGVIDVEDSNYVVREQDAIWMLKLVLPYLNEFLSKLKALFSGDPGTTMKVI